MKKDDQRNIQELWDALKTNGDRYKPVWDDISKYTGISVQPDYMWNNNQSKKSQQLDEFVDDPSSSICVNQAGDYLIGIMWGTGEDVFDIIPSRYVKELANDAEVEEWYNFITEQALYHINHADAGFHTALRPYAYDQFSFGTSGIGCFPNEDFKNRIADNALVFRNYGIDNTRIDEGKSGVPDTVGVIYHWKVNRIIGEFAMTNGAIDQKKFDKLPRAIKNAYNSNQYNTEFDIVCLVYPRHDFDPKLKGKRSARYKGNWFLDVAMDKNIFYEEDFSEKPISMARQIKVRGEVYGRSSGTLLISSIRAVNFMVGTVIEILEKMSNPSLGMFNNAIFGDSVLDTSPNGLTIFNTALAGAQNSPLFPLYDVGNPEGIIKFLIPYLNDKVTTAFKVDALLDFNSAKDMTATESLQRYAIRGKSLSGMLQQQKVELLEPNTKRAISILLGLGELGVDPTLDAKRAQKLIDRGKPERVIPEAVLEVMKSGRPWFELKWNNELEKLTRTEAVQNLVQVLQSIIAISGVYPDIINAVNWYKLLKEINDNLDYNNQVLLSEKDFKAKIAEIAQQRALAMQIQAGEAGGKISKDMATANKQNKEAQVVGQ
jgi:hypothetical protein